MTATSNKRLFIAVNLSIPTTRKVAETLARLRQAATYKRLRVTWVAPQNLHITLKLLGWTHAETAAALEDSLLAVAAGRTGFEVSARGVGAYPTMAAPRVLWVGVGDPEGHLGRLAADVDAATCRLGFERERRPFAAHLTLGRVKEGGDAAADLLAPYQESDFGTSRIRELVLYESVMKSSGSEYTALARAPLGTPPGGGERQTREVQEEAPENEEP